MPSRETLAAASQPISKALAARLVLAYQHATFHPCTYGLRGGATVAAAALIDYNDRGGCCLETREEETIVIDLLPLHRRATMLDRCSNSSFTAQRV
jgi:hypothetical protein